MKQKEKELSFCSRLLNGPYPSHVKELASSRYPLEIYEAGLKEGASAFGPGGYLSIPELPSGTSLRLSRYPEVWAESPFIRILGPAGGWMSAETLEALADLAERYGQGLVHFTTGGTLEIYTTRENIVPLVRELNALGYDVGSTGDDLRCITSCCGPARCDLALVDAPGLATYLGQRFIDDQQYPGFPQKCKSGVAGCPNDCIRAMMQKDHSFIGVYRDLPVIDELLLEEWVKSGGDWQGLIEACPEGALVVEGKSSKLKVDPEACVRCMTCINLCSAIRPGKERGVAWVAGGKYGHRGPKGPMVGYVMVPFFPIRGPEDYDALGDLFGAFLEFWADQAKPKERVGDFISRVGPSRILRELGLSVEPQVVEMPRKNVFRPCKGTVVEIKGAFYGCTG
ncbi:MAG: hypothetical protein L5656_04175 [Thermanaeromonas sp.]|uniref:hypothetical protein n=1 Tax=Thermanaeromonas sp. TaxID=2003697 RepID=UPI002438DB87|nr:hypothetical protein [Thermanaeromonas sp.]MCG0277715.1 hypothetical protein [Thermanaeromonas sp.]